VLTLLLAAASAGAASKCAAPHSSTIASDGAARIYAKHGKVYACLNRNGVTWKLAGASRRHSHFALAGKWVAWTKPLTFDLTRAAKLFIPDGRSHDRDFPYDASGEIGKIVIKPDGALAWAASYQSAPPNVLGERRKGSLTALSQDLNSVVVSSLKPGPGKLVRWRYGDGSKGHAALY
jgi:hypothetical protein